MTSHTSDILVRGATVRPQASRIHCDAMLIREGRVVAIGSEQECEAASPTAYRLDLDGATVLPGFIDGHCHPLMTGQFQAWVDCGWRQAPRIEDVIDVLTTRAAASSGPIRGWGFHHGNVAEQRMLTREDLDRVSRDREVLVFHSSGHGAIANTLLLRKLGIEPLAADPVGGHFGRAEDGTCNGELWDAAADHLTGSDGVKVTNNGPNFHIPDEPAVLDDHLLQAQRALHASGVTSVVDAQVTGREMRSYLRTRSAGQLTLRADMLVISSLIPELESLGLCGRFGDDQLAIAGVKLYADGALTSGTARFSQPYCCAPDDFGYLYHANQELTELIQRVCGLGLQAATHAQGDAAIQVVLEAHAAIEDPHASTRRHRIEHFGGPTPEQVRHAAQLGIWAITQPQYLLHYGDELHDALGERAERVTPLGEIRDCGGAYAISSDSPVCPPSPLEAVQSASMRHTLTGRVLGDDSLRLTLEEGLAAHTRAAAASVHREDSIGALAPGMLADFVVLDRDPFDVATEELSTIQVQQTWVGGRTVFER